MFLQIICIKSSLEECKMIQSTWQNYWITTHFFTIHTQRDRLCISHLNGLWVMIGKICVHIIQISKQSKERVAVTKGIKKNHVVSKNFWFCTSCFGRFLQTGKYVCVFVDVAAKTVFHGTYLRFLWQQYWI